MTTMAKVAGRVLVLVLLILILLAGALVWFDFLGVIDIKTALAPLYRIPFVARVTGVAPRSQSALEPDAFLNLDAERLAVRLEAYSLMESELVNREGEIDARRNEIEQMAAELEERQKSLDERQESMDALSAEATSRERNVEQFARYLNGMPPAAAVGIIGSMDDQNAIETLRKVEAIAQAEGTTSIVSFWLSMLPPERAATLQRKMAQ
jgi:flagellar protein FlbB